MSLEGTIRDLGLQEIGQLLSLGRKSGVLAVRSTLRGARAWLRFVDGALVDAGSGEALPEGQATADAESGDRAAVEENVLEVLAWRDGTFAFTPAAQRGAGASRVRIPTDAMLVESARRDDVWSRVRDRVPSSRAVPSFVDVEPKSLPLLHLVPTEWEVLTRVDGERDLRTLAGLLGRDVMEVAEIVHGLVGTGLLTVRDGGLPVATPVRSAPLSPNAPMIREPIAIPTPPSLPAVSPTALAAHIEEPDDDDDDLWIPTPGELAGFGAPGDDVVFDPQRAGLFGTAPSGSLLESDAPVVTRPAPARVASPPLEPSSHVGRPDGALGGSSDHAPLAAEWREAGHAAARRGDFVTALDCWTRYLRAHERAPDADRVREAIGLAARLHALLHQADRA
jgi:hypothetical protein